MSKTLKDLWNDACREDGVDPSSKFISFSKGNKAAKRYNHAMLLVSKATQKIRR